MSYRLVFDESTQDSTHKRAASDQQVRYAHSAAEVTTNSSGGIEVNPYPSDDPFTPVVLTEEPMWWFCGIMGTSIVGAVAYLLSTFPYLSIIGESYDQYDTFQVCMFYAAILYVIILFCMMVLHMIVVFYSSNPILWYGIATANKVCQWFFYFNVFELFMVFNILDKNQPKRYVIITGVLSSLLIACGCLVSYIGELQFKYVDYLQNQEEKILNSPINDPNQIKENILIIQKE
jgi:hypothetical protein